MTPLPRLGAALAHEGAQGRRAAGAGRASLLDGYQRRWFAGLESLKCGWGGDRRAPLRCGCSTSNGFGSWRARPVQPSATASGEYRGGFDIEECYLTISLGEPYQDACYKLIAAIIPAT